MTPPLVLVADDDADSADLLGRLLELRLPGATVRVAHGGPAALDLALKERPDVAILDLEMPGLKGDALAFALRSAYADGAPLLIVVSGNLARLAEIRPGGAFDHHFGKPADVDGIVGLLREHFASF
jgi:CheY-like chemotaxis protein